MAASTEYTDTLKKIKDTEEQSARELSERRKTLEDELHRLEEESANALAAARAEAEEYVAKEVAKAKGEGELDAKKMLSVTTKEAGATATKKLDKPALAKIVDEILSEFKEA
jgi:vacuolar-type H+-ATPase subunit H